MRRNGPPRLNRFPQRLDYTLIPAPLDLTLPLVDEKALLPAIIVTPSSPSHETDFAIAFFGPTTKTNPLPSQIRLPPTPFKSSFEDSSSWSVKSRARTTIIFAVLLFIMACHLILHQMVTGHPHLQFGMGPDNDMVALNSLVPPTARFGAVSDKSEATTDDPSAATTAPGSNWLDLFWSSPSESAEGKTGPRFIITEAEEELT